MNFLVKSKEILVNDIHEWRQPQVKLNDEWEMISQMTPNHYPN